jgi:hypothetical protein
VNQLERASDADLVAYLQRSAAGTPTADDEATLALSFCIPGVLAEILALPTEMKTRMLAAFAMRALAAPRAAAPRPAVASAA